MMKIDPHPNVIQLVGVALSGGSALVLLEFVDGGSLDRLLAKGHEFTPDELPEFLGQIVSGLAHVHKHNLVHRDLAARNILLSKDLITGKYIPKIADFGLSRVVAEEQNAEGQTKTNFGPVPWMAPEAIGELKYSPQSDVWSLGITFWEIISGLDPSQQMDLIDLAVAIRDSGFHPFIPPFIPSYINEIFEGCWKVTPADRITLAQISKLLSSASFAPPVVRTNKADRKKTKMDGKDKGEGGIAAEVQRLKDRLKLLEKEIAAVLAENAEFEANAPPGALAPKKANNAWRVSVKPSGMSNVVVPGHNPSAEVEMAVMQPNVQGGYGVVTPVAPEPAAEPAAPVRRKKSVRKPNTEIQGYQGVPSGQEGSDLQGSWVPSKVELIAPPSVDADSPYTALPGAPPSDGTPNVSTIGYSTLKDDEEFEEIVSPRSGEKRKKKRKKKKTAKTPRADEDL